MSWVGLVVALLLGWLARGHWERAAMCRHCDVGEGVLVRRTYDCDDCGHEFEVKA